jgi:crotonobetainyl-CoA:carnitine CoA-transferase CaiB-like acyl-CoA transferase
MSYDRPFQGLTVLDASQGIAGPYCAMLLAQQGADVIKLEPPEGDWGRGLGTKWGDLTAVSLSANRGKRSLALDLRKPEGAAVARRLAARADVFMESSRPGVAKRLGLGWETLRADNPRLIYVSVSGFGQQGPHAARPLTDTVAQAFSGVMSINPGNDGVPHKIGIYIVDLVTALYGFQAVSSALYARRDERAGRFPDVSLIQAAAALQAGKIAEHVLEGGKPRLINAPAGSYRTKDGWIAITLVREEQFVRMCEALGRPELPKDPRYLDFAKRADNVRPLIETLQQTLLSRPTAEWLAALHAKDVLCNAIYDYGDWLADAHVQAVGAAPIVEQPGVGPVPTPLIPGVAALEAGDLRALSPTVGQHTAEVLATLGYGEKDLAALERAGVIKRGAPA